MMSPHSLKPDRVILALLLPGVGFLLLELALEPDAVVRALPGLLLWAVLYYGSASLALRWNRKRQRPPGFKTLLYSALLLVALDQACKLLVLRRLPLAWERVPGALILTHVHNLQGSWLAAQFGLDFVGKGLLITVSVLFLILAPSLYRYYLAQHSQPSLWPGIAMVGFVAGLGSAFIDLALRGFTVDYLGFAGLVVADLKDFYINIALAAFCAELAENWNAARRMSNRQTLGHLKQALALSAREIGALLHRAR
jgi:signal peptidase II